MINRFLLSILILLVFLPLSEQVHSTEYRLEGKKVYFKEAEGYWGTFRLHSTHGQGIYYDLLLIEDYFWQKSFGLEVRIIQKEYARLWGLIGYEEYHLNDFHNSLFRSGLRGEFTIPYVRLALGGDLLLDDFVGAFVRYHLDVNLPIYIIKLNAGVGNLLGSKDGYAFWVGISL